MNNLINFNFENHEIRTVMIDNEFYFVGKDVAEVLDYSNSKDALAKHVDDEDKLKSQIATLAQNRRMTVINESGLYSLIMSSKMPNAKKFKRWVTSEVLPKVRKTGAYLTDEKVEEILANPDTIIKLATQIKLEREGRLIAEQQVKEYQPKVSYYDKVLANKSLMTITTIAKDYGMSGSEMNKVLHNLKVQYKQGRTWLLYSRYQRNGWTHSDTHMITRKDGTEKLVVNTKWTQKGRLGLYELLKNNNILPVIEQDEVSEVI